MVSISEVGYRKARTSGNGRPIQSLELRVLADPRPSVLRRRWFSTDVNRKNIVLLIIELSVNEECVRLHSETLESDRLIEEPRGGILRVDANFELENAVN
jgi:hypothetical protein